MGELCGIFVLTTQTKDFYVLRKGVHFLDKKKIIQNDTRGLVRGLECAFEILGLSVLYYFVWRFGYGDGVFPDYHYNGKYVLAGVYGLLVVLLFSSLDGFKIGQLKTVDIAMGQWIGLFIVNFITYNLSLSTINTVILC